MIIWHFITVCSFYICVLLVFPRFENVIHIMTVTVHLRRYLVAQMICHLLRPHRPGPRPKAQLHSYPQIYQIARPYLPVLSPLFLGTEAK